ncbi:TRAP transporter large permease [Aquimixticola soesokkakensis]|nr:TRAP transporter large permease [Aquimixticola soesokkakensis]
MAFLIVFGTLVALITLTRIPLGFVMVLCGIGGIALLHPRGFDAAFSIAEREIVNLAMNEQFATMPLFVMMGVFVVKAGLADDLFGMAQRWIGHKRGGLGMATILACGGFAALSGSSTASAATMAKICVPPMRDADYDEGFSAAAVAAGGTMGILIPPSGALIVYALLTEESIGELFIAGLVPGLLQLFLYVIAGGIVARLFPLWAPAGPVFGWRDRFAALGKVWGVLALFAMVMLGLVFGIFTATEAAGFGAGGAFLFSVARGRMSFGVLAESLREAARISGMIFLVASGALVLNQFVNISGLAGDLVGGISNLGLSPFHVILCLIAFYMVLGCFLDGFAIIFLTVPVVVPVVAALGYDLVWWGIVTVIIVEISLITPPVGMNVYILKAMLPKVSIMRIFRGVMPFFVMDMLRLVAILAFPMIALWLVEFSR